MQKCAYLREMLIKILCINFWFALWSSIRSSLRRNNIKDNVKFLIVNTYIPVLLVRKCEHLWVQHLFFPPNSSLNSSTGLFPWPLQLYMSILNKSKNIGCCFFLFSPLQIEEFFTLPSDHNQNISWQYYFSPTHLYDVVFILAHERNRSKRPLAVLLLK